MMFRGEEEQPLLLDDQAGPARRISAARGEEMVREAMRRVEVGEPSGGRVHVPRGMRRAVGWGVLLVALFVTGSAGAVFLVARGRWAKRATPAFVEPTVFLRRDPAAEAAVARPKTSLPLEIPPLLDAIPDEPPLADDLPIRSVPARDPASAEELLRRASELRAKHRWIEATRAYEQTLRSFPGGEEAYSAAVAAGFLHLDHLGDPRGALRLFSAALRLRPDGGLSEEVRWGRIEAYGTLGDAILERTSLRDFVTRYPKSLFSSRADERLRDLAGTP